MAIPFNGNPSPTTTYPKDQNSFNYPVHTTSTSNLLKRVEPVIDPRELRNRFLKGILERLPKGMNYTDEDLKNRIDRAINELELDLGTPVFAEQVRDRLIYDFNLYKQWIKLRAQHAPILVINSLSITDSSNSLIFTLPASWLETTGLYRGDINVIPLLSSYGASLTQGTLGGGLAYLTILAQSVTFIPAYWQLDYLAGISATPGQVPVPVNELIGIMATKRILSEIAANNINTSISLSSDGISQGSSNPGTSIYNQRNEDLEVQRVKLLREIRLCYLKKYFVGTI
jgi:hypothetical protein